MSKKKIPGSEGRILNDDSNISDIVKNIFYEKTECHFSKGNQPVCSPSHVVEKMKKFLKKNNTNTGNSNEQIVSNMKNYLNCDSESCIFKNREFLDFAKINNLDEFLQQIFKPVGPTKQYGLLSNFNIDDVLDQLEKTFPERKFLHIGYQMIDFQDPHINTQLATVDLKDQFLNKGIKTFGVVLNTDKTAGHGKHWFCLFGEYYGDKIDIEYFNSSGNCPPPEVQIWLNKKKHELTKEMNIPVNIIYHQGAAYQIDTHSCGVYCLCYIWGRLSGIPARWFSNRDHFTDNMMHEARDNLFRYA